MNDTQERMFVHPASAINYLFLEPAQTVSVEVPEGTYPFVKLWNDGVVLLSFLTQEPNE